MKDILVWCKSKLAEHISVIKTEKYYIWLKLHNIGLTETTTYLCAAYIPPAESEYYEEVYFNNLYSDISYFQAQGKVLLCGDFNARTGVEPDFIDPQGSAHVFGQSSLHLSPTTTTRKNLDCVVNNSGSEVARLCRALGLYILNGRIPGDSLGRFTFSSALGNSVVDYAITDMDPFYFSAFTVRRQTPFSDHNQINIFLKMTNRAKNTCRT